MKWNPKNNIGVSVGYSDEVKGYKVYFPQKIKLEFHRDIIFLPDNKNEQDFVPEGEAEAIIQLENFEEHEAQETENMNLENEIMIQETDHDQDLEEVLDDTRSQRYNFRQNRR
ncbi:hypothetical protein JTB14_011492 [Gonioctena quinquepunctata]|nr:hypothetical protein JTB14_011492 [Gonioctena quinquepunctata]